MSIIEHRIEATGEQPDYSGRVFTAEEIAAGAHRRFIGGVWNSHGNRQLEFLVGQGLRPEHRLLDVGCGPFRAGRHFIDYLEPGHYFGIDANHSLITTGYERELTEQQRAKLPVTNLRANDRFDGDFGVPIDYAIANSVFTHVSLNHIRLCLFRLGKVVRPGGSFYATFFERRARTPVDHIGPSKRDKPFFTEKNVFWYYRGDLEWASTFGPWEYRYIGDWGHPAGQKMVQFVRLTDEEVAARAAARARAARAPRTAGQEIYRDVKRLVRRVRRAAGR
jgi:SAM-dependent methyltransferase